MTEANEPPRDAKGPARSVPDVGLPARLDMRRAFDIYISGRNRTLGPAEKRAMVGGSVETPYAAPSEANPDPASPQPGAAVSVPEELRFDRNAGTWRRDQGS
jgi:hypothetical protein